MKITRDQKIKIKDLAKKYHLNLVLAFGSQVQGKTHPKSDLDIAILKGKRIKTFKKYSDFIFSLEKIFKGKEIDLIFIERADPLLLYYINKTGLPLYYKNPRMFEEFKFYAFKKYQDYQPYFKLEEKFVSKFIQHLRK